MASLDDLLRPQDITVRLVDASTGEALALIELPAIALDGLSRERILLEVERFALNHYGPGVAVDLLTEGEEPIFVLTRDDSALAHGVMESGVDGKEHYASHLAALRTLWSHRPEEPREPSGLPVHPMRSHGQRRHQCRGERPRA